jgi:hypothetical protein
VTEVVDDIVPLFPDVEQIVLPVRIRAIGKGFIVTENCDVVTAHVVAVIVSVTVSQPEPTAFQVTVTEFVPAPPVIVPPEIAQT